MDISICTIIKPLKQLTVDVSCG